MELTSAPPPPPRVDDHVRGRPGGALVLVYADLACPRCAVLWTRLPDDARVVFRHMALRAKHRRAVALAQAAEAAGAQGAFVPFVDAVYRDQGRIDDPHLWARCEALGLDLERFEADRRDERAVARVRRDTREAMRAGAVSTPAAFACGPRSAAMLAEIGFAGIETRPGNDGRGRTGRT